MIKQVRPIEWCSQNETVLYVEHLLYVDNDLRRGRCSYAQYGNIRKHCLQIAQELVVGPEVVAPARATVHLIDGEHTQFTGKVGLLESGQKSFALCQPLWGNVQQFKIAFVWENSLLMIGI